jgi:AbrB family looped-hinge helix DNA binding protein
LAVAAEGTLPALLTFICKAPTATEFLFNRGIAGTLAGSHHMVAGMYVVLVRLLLLLLETGTMRITSKGQVTIPLEIRRKLGLLPNVEVTFEIAGNSVRIRKAKSGSLRGRELIQRIKGKASSGLTTDQIMALTRG